MKSMFNSAIMFPNQRLSRIIGNVCKIFGFEVAESSSLELFRINISGFL